MKGRICITAALGLAALGAFAAAPTVKPTIPYRAVLTDKDGTPLSTTTNIVFAIYDTATNGAPLWTRGFTNVVLRSGLVNLVLDDDPTVWTGSPTTLERAIRNSRGRALYLGMRLGRKEIEPRQKIPPTAYAAIADYALGASGDFSVAGALSTGGDAAFTGTGDFVGGLVGGQGAKVGGDMTVKGRMVVKDDLSVGGNLIVGGDLRGSGTTAAAVSRGMESTNLTARSLAVKSGNFTIKGREATLPKGMIVLWNSKNAIPKGWEKCDGQGGRPDLNNDRFVIGAGDSYQPKTTGGANFVTLVTNQIPAHTHSLTDLRWISFALIGTSAYDGIREGTGKKMNTEPVGGDSHENRPPFVRLFYIIKVE